MQKSSWPRYCLTAELRLLIEFNKARDRGDVLSDDTLLAVTSAVRVAMVREAAAADMQAHLAMERAKRREGQAARDRLRYYAPGTRRRVAKVEAEREGLKLFGPGWD